MNFKNDSKTPESLKIIVAALLVFTCLAIADIVITSNIKKDNDQKILLQRNAKEKADKELEAQKAKEKYDLCIKNANDLWLKSLNNASAELSYSERIEYSKAIQSTIESYKNDCDRDYAINRPNP